MPLLKNNKINNTNYLLKNKKDLPRKAKLHKGNFIREKLERTAAGYAQIHTGGESKAPCYNVQLKIDDEILII